MAITGIQPPSSGTASQTTAQAANAKLSNNYQMFLQLLTTQLKNQSPLSPMDADKFTEQLVQYSSVEQQIGMNATLADIKSSLAVQNATGFVSYVGTTVTADGSKSTLQNGKAEWSYTLPKAATATITVRDSSGNVVYTKTESGTSGANTFSWDGTNSKNGKQADGTYTISIEAKDAAGSGVTASTDVNGKVTQLDLSGGQPYLVINGQRVSVWSVTKVSAAPAS